jgi:hypothetical protein
MFGIEPKSLGISGFIGLILGLGVVYWVAPETGGGVALILFVFVAGAIAIGQLLTGHGRSGGTSKGSSEPN